MDLLLLLPLGCPARRFPVALASLQAALQTAGGHWGLLLPHPQGALMRTAAVLLSRVLPLWVASSTAAAAAAVSRRILPDDWLGVLLLFRFSEAPSASLSLRLVNHAIQFLASCTGCDASQLQTRADFALLVLAVDFARQKQQNHSQTQNQTQNQTQHRLQYLNQNTSELLTALWHRLLSSDADCPLHSLNLLILLMDASCPNSLLPLCREALEHPSSLPSSARSLVRQYYLPRSKNDVCPLLRELTAWWLQWPHGAALSGYMRASGLLQELVAHSVEWLSPLRLSVALAPLLPYCYQHHIQQIALRAFVELPASCCVDLVAAMLRSCDDARVHRFARHSLQTLAARADCGPAALSEAVLHRLWMGPDPLHAASTPASIGRPLHNRPPTDPLQLLEALLAVLSEVQMLQLARVFFTLHCCHPHDVAWGAMRSVFSVQFMVGFLGNDELAPAVNSVRGCIEYLALTLSLSPPRKVDWVLQQCFAAPGGSPLFLYLMTAVSSMIQRATLQLDASGDAPVLPHVVRVYEQALSLLGDSSRVAVQLLQRDPKLVAGFLQTLFCALFYLAKCAEAPTNVSTVVAFCILQGNQPDAQLRSTALRVLGVLLSFPNQLDYASLIALRVGLESSLRDSDPSVSALASSLLQILSPSHG